MEKILHDQTIFGDPARGDGHDAQGRPGDCWKACIATLLQIPDYDSVPHFVASGESWWQETYEYVYHQTNKSLMKWRDEKYIPTDQEMFVGVGPSPRGDFYHAVLVDRHGKLIHDPHPSRMGVVDVEEFYGLA